MALTKQYPNPNVLDKKNREFVFRFLSMQNCWLLFLEKLLFLAEKILEAAASLEASK